MSHPRSGASASHPPLDDGTLLSAFEGCTLSPGSFGHREHVRVAWLYLCTLSFAAAGLRFSTNLQRFAAAHGVGGRYHETITWAYLTLINERMHTTKAADFDSFLAQHGDLLDQKGGALATLYDEATLKSDIARRVFVLPRTGYHSR